MSVATLDPVALFGVVALLGGLGSVAEWWNVLVNGFEVGQRVVVTCYYVVDSVGSWLLADVTDSFVTLQYDKASG